MASLPRVSDRNRLKKLRNNSNNNNNNERLCQSKSNNDRHNLLHAKRLNSSNNNSHNNNTSSSPSQLEEEDDDECCNGHGDHHNQHNNTEEEDSNKSSEMNDSGKVRKSFKTNGIPGEQSAKQQENYCDHTHSESVKPAAVKRRGVRPVERERMRPWLSRLLNLGNIPGLQWVDKKKKIFRIPWKHGSSQNWTPTDANLFVKWAEHTGRFVPTEDKPNTKRFKATFRCALNSLPDCKELPNLNHKGGINAYKVYQFFCNKKNCPFNEDKEEDKSKWSYNNNNNNNNSRPKSPIKRNNSMDSSMSCNSVSESDSSETLISDSEVANTLLQLHRGTMNNFPIQPPPLPPPPPPLMPVVQENNNNNVNYSNNTIYTNNHNYNTTNNNDSNNYSINIDNNNSNNNSSRSLNNSNNNYSNNNNNNSSSNYSNDYSSSSNNTSPCSNPAADAAAAAALTQLTQSRCSVPSLPVVSSPPEQSQQQQLLVPVTAPIIVAITQQPGPLTPTVVPLTPPAELPVLIHTSHLTPQHQNPFFHKVTECSQPLPVTSCPKQKLLSDHCYIDDIPLKAPVSVQVKEEVADPGYVGAEHKTMMPLVKVKLENVETGRVAAAAAAAATTTTTTAAATTCWKHNEENNQEGAVQVLTDPHFQQTWKFYQPSSNLSSFTTTPPPLPPPPPIQPPAVMSRNVQVLATVNKAAPRKKLDNSSRHSAKIPIKKKRTIPC